MGRGPFIRVLLVREKHFYKVVLHGRGPFMGVSYSVGHPTTETGMPIQVYPASELIASGHPSGVGQTPQCRTTSDFGLLFGTCLVPFSIFLNGISYPVPL